MTALTLAVRQEMVTALTFAAYLNLAVAVGEAFTAGRVADHIGPIHQCWENTQRFCRADPEKYAYLEGICRRTPWQLPMPHGFAVERSTGTVVECTAQYDKSLGYRGVELALETVDGFHADHPEGLAEGARQGLLWVVILGAVAEGKPVDISPYVPEVTNRRLAGLTAASRTPV